MIHLEAMTFYKIVLIIWSDGPLLLLLLLGGGVIAPVLVAVAVLGVGGSVLRPLGVLDTAGGVGLLQDGRDGLPLAPLQGLVLVHLLGTASLGNDNRFPWIVQYVRNATKL